MKYKIGGKCYKHKPEPVTEAKETTLLWDFALQPDLKNKEQLIWYSG